MVFTADSVIKELFVTSFKRLAGKSLVFHIDKA